MIDNFYSDVRSKIASRSFDPKVIDKKKIEKEKSRIYESKPETKEKHRKWNKTPAGKASSSRRSKKYSESHPEKRREISNRYYERHKDEIATKRKEKRLADPDGFKAKRKKWPSSQPEYTSRYMKNYRKKKKEETENAENKGKPKAP